MKQKHAPGGRWFLMAATVIILLCSLIGSSATTARWMTCRAARLTMHELYERADAGEEIDTLFLGSSHCYRAYDRSSTKN